MSKVYIVHCIDTEGPLLESPEAPFQLIKNVFNIDIEPSEENLIKLRKKQIDLNGLEDAVANIVDQRKATLGTWTEIDSMLKRVMSPKFREELKDSDGNGWIYTWCCVAHTGFTGVNPRHRDSGYNNIFDHYKRLVEAQKYGDVLGFHYHPVSLSGNYNDSGTAYWGGENLNNILSHLIIDRGWFPSVFRPGFNTERPDSNWFLEQWIPFDYANNSTSRNNSDQPDLIDGRFGDWRRAPKEWLPYHPDHDDYQKVGSCRRLIARILNMYARLCEVNELDIREGFEQAKIYGKSLIAFANHDYRDMAYDIERVRNMLKSVSKEFPDVEFVYADGITAMREVAGIDTNRCGISARIDKSGLYPKLVVKSENSLFGPQPYLAIKGYGNHYYWDNFDFYDNKTWTYTFDNNTMPLNHIEKIGIATNSFSGVAEVIVIDVEKESVEKRVWNDGTVSQQ